MYGLNCRETCSLASVNSGSESTNDMTSGLSPRTKHNKCRVGYLLKLPTNIVKLMITGSENLMCDGDKQNMCASKAPRRDKQNMCANKAPRLAIDIVSADVGLSLSSTISSLLLADSAMAVLCPCSSFCEPKVLSKVAMSIPSRGAFALARRMCTATLGCWSGWQTLDLLHRARLRSS